MPAKVHPTNDPGYNAEQALKWDLEGWRRKAAGAPKSWVDEAFDKAKQWAQGIDQ